MAQAFAGGAFAGGDAQQQRENFPADFAHRRRSIGDAPGVHVHIVAHAGEGVRIARDLNHRNGSKADGASPAGGERDQVGAAGRQSGERYRIVARRVHENKAGRAHALGVIDDIVQRGGSRLGHRASDFSRMFDSPPSLFPGVGLSSKLLPAKRLKYAWYWRMHPSSFSATARLRARRTSRCSAPKISVVSASTADPPACAIRSEQTPSAGLAVMPLKESDPPQFSPRTIFDAGVSTRFSFDARPIIRSISRRAASTVARVPPLACSVRATGALQWPSWLTSHPRPSSTA